MVRPTRSSSNHRPRAQRSGRHRERAEAVRRPKTVGGVPPALALALLVVAAYLPALRAGFIWDDDAYVTANRDAANARRAPAHLARARRRPPVLPAHLHEPLARPSPLGSPAPRLPSRQRAAFSKENVLVLLPGLVAYDLILGRRWRWRNYAVVLSAVAAYLAMRGYVQSIGPPPAATSPVDNPLVESGFWAARLTAVEV